MSPATSNGTYGFTYYARNCYDTLVVRENGEFKAGLAETWDISDDGLTYTFHLKEGVKFSDGADLNAEAVKTSLEAAFSNLEHILHPLVRLEHSLSRLKWWTNIPWQFILPLLIMVF